MRLTMRAIVSHHGVPMASNQGFILNPEFSNLALLPRVPMTVAVFLRFVQVDQKLCLPHTSPSSNKNYCPSRLSTASSRSGNA